VDGFLKIVRTGSVPADSLVTPCGYNGRDGNGKGEREREREREREKSEEEAREK